MVIWPHPMEPANELSTDRRPTWPHNGQIHVATLGGYAMHCSPPVRVKWCARRGNGTEMRGWTRCAWRMGTRGRDDDDAAETRPRLNTSFTVRDTMTTSKTLRTRSVAGSLGSLTRLTVHEWCGITICSLEYTPSMSRIIRLGCFHDRVLSSLITSLSCLACAFGGWGGIRVKGRSAETLSSLPGMLQRNVYLKSVRGSECESP